MRDGLSYLFTAPLLTLNKYTFCHSSAEPTHKKKCARSQIRISAPEQFTIMPKICETLTLTRRTTGCSPSPPKTPAAQRLDPITECVTRTKRFIAPAKTRGKTHSQTWPRLACVSRLVILYVCSPTRARKYSHTCTQKTLQNHAHRDGATERRRQRRHR